MWRFLNFFSFCPLVATCLLVAKVRAGSDLAISRQLQTQPFIDQYCASCHNGDKKKGDLDLEKLSSQELTANSEAWEKVVRKLRTRQMPPPKRKRPDEKGYREILNHLEAVLDTAADQHPNPGRTESIRRLNRTEYQNSIRDLL
ncbi:MAG TPA: c-type cytochrome domain-containing protein, partial [Verrucomicrobiae bacterium]|nr:c-type cytochrome domain-containing protein [Verrucomicrobiae bacterium]